MVKEVRFTWLIAVGVLFANFFFAPARADEDGIAPFYRGKQINVIVGTSPGGGYDLYARLLARHMGRHIPGEPSIIVKYQPGVGGLVMATAPSLARIAQAQSGRPMLVFVGHEL